MDLLSYPVTGDHHLSDGWEDHIARGSLGGVDFPVPYGTPVYATHDGFLSVDNSPSGSGGRVATVQGGGITDQCLHMSSFARGNGNVSRGELVGYSGASAYGSDYGTGGPHLHWHAIINGIRVNPLNYLAGESDVAGGNARPIGDEDLPLNDADKEWIQAQFALVTAQYNNEISGIKGILAQTDEIEGGGSGPYTTVQSKLDLLLAWVGGGSKGDNKPTAIRTLVTKIAEKLGVGPE